MADYHNFKCDIKFPSSEMSHAEKKEFLIGQLNEIILAIKDNKNDDKLSFEGKKTAAWEINAQNVNLKTIADNEIKNFSNLTPLLQENKIFVGLDEILTDEKLDDRFGISVKDDLFRKINNGESISEADRLLIEVANNSSLGQKILKENSILYSAQKLATIEVNEKNPLKDLQSRSINFANILKKNGFPPEEAIHFYLTSVPHDVIVKNNIDIKKIEDTVKLISSSTQPNKTREPAKEIEKITEEEMLEYAKTDSKKGLPPLKFNSFQMRLNIPEDVIKKGQTREWISEKLNSSINEIHMGKNLKSYIYDDNKIVGIWKDEDTLNKVNSLMDKKQIETTPTLEMENKMLSTITKIFGDSNYTEKNSFKIIEGIQKKIDFDFPLSLEEKIIYKSSMDMEAISRNLQQKTMEESIRQFVQLPLEKNTPDDKINEKYVLRGLKLSNQLLKTVVNTEHRDKTFDSINTVLSYFTKYLPDSNKINKKLINQSLDKFFQQNMKQIDSNLDKCSKFSNITKKVDIEERTR